MGIHTGFTQILVTVPLNNTFLHKFV